MSKEYKIKVVNCLTKEVVAYYEVQEFDVAETVNYFLYNKLDKDENLKLIVERNKQEVIGG